MNNTQNNTAALSTFALNILSVYLTASENQKQDGANWYNSAREISKTLAKRHSITILKAAGIIAALSPMKSWTQNVKDATRILAGYKLGLSALEQGGTFKAGLKKVDSILALPNSANFEEICAILNGPKIKSFFACIVDLKTNDVCIDGHAQNLANYGLARVSISKAPGMSAKAYKAFQAAYAETAKFLGVSASVLQAVTWVTYREFSVAKES